MTNRDPLRTKNGLVNKTQESDKEILHFLFQDTVNANHVNR